MVDGNWPSEWLKGILPLCVLAIVAEGETHGYAIAQELDARGIPGVKGGTLYPLLNRLETDGLVQTRWTQGPSGPGRKLYVPTTLGRRWLKENAARWLEFMATTQKFLQHPTESDTQ